ncbi:PAS domain S-box-containing protein [Trichlorobacter thiogenes]|uniref:histidine kinase n=1 Tax=Trichlorobacter thiogenes TaxID=115783 RepID=A0A1T4R0H5_9BACT|nr:PAS domain S-box protein [Trichlorobacter thiogenes]SKA09367.1 PAS domain S-box-containing protein [Trichlorobacter thiogenes]
MVNRFKNLSITIKATLLLSLTAMFFLLVLSGVTYLFARHELQQSIATNQTAAVNSLAAQLDENLAASRNYLHYLATHLQQIHASKSSDLQNTLKHHDESRLFFDAGLILLSAQGRIVAETPYNKERIGLDQHEREYYQQVVKSGKSVVSAPYKLSSSRSQPVIAFAVPVKDGSNSQLHGVLVGRRNLQKNGFLQKLIDAPIGKNGYFYLIDQDRTLIIHPDPSRILTTIPAGKNKAIDAALAGQEGTWENVNSLGIPGLTSIKPLKEAPWYLAAQYPLSEAYAPLHRARLAFGVVLFISMALAVVAVWFSMQPVVRPLQRLTNHLQQLGTKQGADRFLTVNSQDEIGHLTTVFNELLQELDDDVEAQEEAAEVYRIITEFTNEVSLWQLENGDIRYISPNCVRFFGYMDAEFYACPKLLNALIHPDDQKTWSNHQPGSCSMGGEGLEIRLITKDGSLSVFRHYCHQVVDKQGSPNGIRSSWLDITGQQQMESMARKLSRAVEQSSSTIVITNIDGAIEYVNPRFCLTTGYTADEVMGMNPRVLKSGDMPPEEYRELWRTITSGKEWRGEFHNKRKDGTLYWEAASILPLTDKNGVIIGYLAVKDDISEKKAAEYLMIELFQQVETAKKEWENTLDHLRDFIILTDPEHKIRRYNRILMEMTSLSSSDLVGRDWRELLQEMGFKFINFNASSGELLHLRSGRNYDINVYPVKSEHDDTQGFVVSLNDTTELHTTAHELEKALAELEDAQLQIYQQEKMASIGQLAAGVAHEINNPMGFITSNLSSLEKYVSRLYEYIGVVDQAMQGCCEGALAEPVHEARKRLKIDRILDDAHQLIEESQDGAGRVRRIVQDLKNFSRVDQAETALINLNESLETTINIAWNELKYVADLHREFGDIPKVNCFPQQLNQVFLNLLVNSAHALGETRGDITVQTEQQGDQVLVKISDTGCGMPPEVQRRIFEPFFTTKEVGKGTGLGLSISYDIIKKHGGSIEVQSEVGRGTTFTVVLPVHGPCGEEEQPSCNSQQ